jgi:hypothetical protein
MRPKVGRPLCIYVRDTFREAAFYARSIFFFILFFFILFLFLFLLFFVGFLLIFCSEPLYRQLFFLRYGDRCMRVRLIGNEEALNRYDSYLVCRVRFSRPISLSRILSLCLPQRELITLPYF